MRILVTGSRGLLGSTLVPHLRAAGHDVVAHSRAAPEMSPDDLGDPGRTRLLLQRWRPAAVVNLAAMTSVDECEREPQRAYLANVRIVENLAAAIGSADFPCHLLQISTDHVYDGAGPHREDDVVMRNTYAFSKYAGELAAGPASTVLRTNFFGRSLNPSRVSFSDWLVRSLRGNVPITVFEDVWFSPLSLASLSEVLGRAVAARPAGVFNLGSRDGMTKADFAFALADVLGLSTQALTRGRSATGPGAVPRPKDMRMDSSRLEERLGLSLPSLAAELRGLHDSYQHED